jgi:putative FmdB family regulatory protein
MAVPCIWRWCLSRNGPTGIAADHAKMQGSHLCVARIDPLPLYEYECQKCHTRTERIEKLSGPHLKVCPKCKGRVERLISPPAIQFKGSGWYVTDYAKSSSAGTAGESGKSEGTSAATAEKPAADAGSKAKSAPAKSKKTGSEK